MAHRKLLNPAFSIKILMSFIPIFNRETEKLNRELENCIGQEIDAHYLLQKCALDTACRKCIISQFHN